MGPPAGGVILRHSMLMATQKKPTHIEQTLGAMLRIEGQEVAVKPALTVEGLERTIRSCRRSLNELVWSFVPAPQMYAQRWGPSQLFSTLLYPKQSSPGKSAAVGCLAKRLNTLDRLYDRIDCLSFGVACAGHRPIWVLILPYRPLSILSGLAGASKFKIKY